MEGKRTGRSRSGSSETGIDSSSTQGSPSGSAAMGERRTGEPPQPRGRKAAAGNGGGKTGRARGAGTARGAESNGLRRELRDFAASKPGGWVHEDWTGLLDQLRKRGHDTSDPDRIGRDLERERLRIRLEEISGVGPSRVKSLVDRFETLWSLRNARVDEIASVQGINRGMAEKIKDSLSS